MYATVIACTLKANKSTWKSILMKIVVCRLLLLFDTLKTFCLSYNGPCIWWKCLFVCRRKGRIEAKSRINFVHGSWITRKRIIQNFLEDFFLSNNLMRCQMLDQSTILLNENRGTKFQSDRWIYEYLQANHKNQKENVTRNIQTHTHTYEHTTKKKS